MDSDSTASSHLPPGPLPALEDPSQAVAYLRGDAFDAPKISRVIAVTEEFTSLCPKTGQPDFGTVTVDYEPREKCLESKALKLYLGAFRNVGCYVEGLAARIADDIVEAIRPWRLTVTVTQKPRGGIAITARAERVQLRP